MLASQQLLATVKEPPADAEVNSHRLMLRAGLIRQVAAGVYDWLPTGVRILRRVENIVRAEMNRAGAQEVLLPMVQPAELWRQSGRWEQYGKELLRLADRHRRDFCLGPTHEEIITTLVKNELRSYRQLPMNFYQIQTKFRDEIRPRFGVLRGREFIMKDAYSFDLTRADLQRSYDLMYKTYCAIFDRLGLTYRAVAADSGQIGGDVSHEFHVLADSGEDAIAYDPAGDYAANVELTPAPVPANPRAAPREELRLADTPNTKTIDALVQGFKIPIEKTIKTLVVKAAAKNTAGVAGHNLIALLVRGDHELNAAKAEKLPQVASPLRMADKDEIYQAIGAGAGSLGPVNLPIPFIADHTVAAMADFAAGANAEDKHYFGINWARDVALTEVADLRKVVDGDPSPGGGKLTVARGIEVGHIFQLGDKYSRALGATVLDENGASVELQMGCYGIGVTRVIAAAIEQHHDDKGIIWPAAIAPYHIVICPLGHQRDAQVKTAAHELHDALAAAGLEVLLDDRDERPGVMFADSELLGIPHRLVIGAKSLARGVAEYQPRTGDGARDIKLAEAVDIMLKLCTAEN